MTFTCSIQICCQQCKKYMYSTDSLWVIKRASTICRECKFKEVCLP